MRERFIMMVLLALAPTIALADAWDRAITDTEILDEVFGQDIEDLSGERADLELELQPELFPILEGEEKPSAGLDPFALSDTYLTIKVDGVPVVVEDVELRSWFALYVRDVAARSLISGYRDAEGRPTGKFGPADFVTIEQLAKMAVIASQIDPFACGEELRNPAAELRWSLRYIRCAEFSGWAVYSDGAVDPARPATRAEVVVTVLQAFSARISPRSGSVFGDVTASTEFAAAIETASLAGIVSGYADADGRPTGYFGPVDPVNRAETAKIFSLAFQVFGD